jgi:serine O-acetyltransferase
MTVSGSVSIDQLSEQLVALQPSSSSSGDDVTRPCVSSLIAIAGDIRELLFSGYRAPAQPASTDARLRCSSLLRHVQSRLTVEVDKALSHTQPGNLRIHRQSSPTAGSSHSSTATDLVTRFLASLPQLRTVLSADVQAAFDGDPAAQTNDEIILCYPGIEAVWVHRVAHQLLQLGVPLLPRILAEWAHRETGIDIHPGATIGPSFFIDHGTGVVIGETCCIGSHVTLYQGVTLGAWSFPRDEDGNLIRGTKRHPTLEDNVTVYSNATILGGTTVIGSGSQIGSNVTLSRTIPPNTIVTIEPPSLRFREAG